MDSIPAVQNDKISAYYCLLFPNFTYYLQTLTVSIGRRPSAPSVSSDPADVVDIDLGPLTQVSRLHARIEYDEDQEQFVLAVLGRNGAWVDGVWYASGRRVPLAARTQIMIATQTFHFILPSTPDTDDSPMTSSCSSSHERSPSVDILSLSPASPAHSDSAELSLDDQNGEPNHAFSATKSKANRKRKRVSAASRAAGRARAIKAIPPEEMPPKPAITYANLSYRAIKAHAGRATLQHICQWIATTYDWYRLNEGSGWESSVRHTLSSNKAFTKVSRKSTDKGKGFFWTVTKAYEKTFESQKVTTPPKRSSTQSADNAEDNSPLPVVVSRRPTLQEPRPVVPLPPSDVHVALPTPASTPVPSAPALASSSTQHSMAHSSGPKPSSSSKDHSAGDHQYSRTTTSQRHVHQQLPPSADGMQDPHCVILPIIVKELPPDHPAVLASVPLAGPAAAFLTTPPIVHDRSTNTVVLSPTVFGNLTQARIKELQNSGFQKALEELKLQIVQFVKEKLTSEASNFSSMKSKRAQKMKVKAKSSLGAASRSSQNGTLEPANEVSTAAGKEPPAKKRKVELLVVD